MKTKSILVLLLAMSIAFTSCKKNENYVTPSGNVTTQSKPITGFNALDISDQFKVYVTFSATEESVNIEADDNLQSYIQVSKNNDRLVVKLDDNINIREGEATLNIHVSIIDLEKIEGAGATSFYFQNGLIGNELELNLTGACSLTGLVNLNQLNATITGSSNLSITGTTETFKIDATGASNMEGYGFETYKLEADLEGASNLNLTVHEKMDVKASGASTVYYKGNGFVNSQNLSGASEIIKVQ